MDGRLTLPAGRIDSLPTLDPLGFGFEAAAHLIEGVQRPQQIR
jgi:hypothetical protein